MWLPELIPACEEIIVTLPRADRLALLRSEWRIVTAALREDLIATGDRLMAGWPEPLLADQIPALLHRCRVLAAAGGTDRPTWYPRPEEILLCWRDCLAIGYHRLYHYLAAQPAGRRRAAAQGERAALNRLWSRPLATLLQLLAALEAAGDPPALPPDRPFRVGAASPLAPLTWRLRSPAFATLYKNLQPWQLTTTGQPAPLAASLPLLALALLLVNEETSTTPEPLWILAAGPKGGVGQITVAILAVDDTESAWLEQAPWGRYHLSLAPLQPLIPALQPYLGGAVTHARIACNPPGITPAAAGYIQSLEPEGESIGLALALGLYSAQQHAAPGGYAVTGAVGDRTLRKISGVKDKLEKLARFNQGRPADQRVRRVLLPTTNLDRHVRAAADAAGLLLNQTPGGEIVLTTLADLLQPAVLSDALHAYIAALLLQATELATKAPAAWELANRVVANILGAATDEVAPTRRVGWHLLPAPSGVTPAAVASYLAGRLGQARREWAARFTRGLEDGGRPPAPVILEPTALEQGWEAATIRQVERVGGPAAGLYTRYAWQTTPGEFTLLVSGDDSLVRAYLLAPPASPAPGPFLVAIARDVEQLHTWAVDLERSGEPLMPPLDTWYGPSSGAQLAASTGPVRVDN